MPFNNPIGELSALSAAFLWALSSLLFRCAGVVMPPLLLNLCKGVLATVLLSATLWALETPWAGFTTASVVWLLISGAIGIGIGDTAFFAALNRLGERRSVLMVETLAPPLAVLLAWLLLGEWLSLPALFGIGLILAGVAWVLTEKRGDIAQYSWTFFLPGVLLGGVAAFCQAFGAVISRGVFYGSDMSVLWSTDLRLMGGVALLVLFMPLAKPRQRVSVPIRWKLIAAVIAATLLGTCLGIFLQQLSLKHTSAGIAQTLLATSSLFVIPLVALKGERVSLRSIGGAVVALAGIMILFQV